MKKRTLILIAALILVLLLVFLIVRTAVNDSLGPKVKRASASFVNGVTNPDGTIAQSVNDALYQRLDASDRLQTLAAKFDEVYSEYTALRNAHNAMLELVKERSDFAGIIAADKELESAFEACRSALEPLVSGKNADTLARSAEDLSAAADAIRTAAESYNGYIRSFRASTLNRFPNSILKVFLACDEPELWPVG